MKQKSFFLVKNTTANKAFKLQECPIPEPKGHEVVVKAEAFGLNFADVVARHGQYQDCPPLPCVIGYEMVGRIHKLGKDVEGLKEGQRVTAMTRFGGYAQYAVSDSRAVVPIPEDMDAGVAASLTTQGVTAYYCANVVTNLYEGDHVLIQAAAGGVGHLLVQMAKNKGCVVYGTAGSEKKLEYLRSLGVDFPINYNTTDYEQFIKNKRGDLKLDAIFDSLGGNHVKKGLRLLSAGGRIMCFGAASRTNAKWGFLSTLNLAWGFGVFSPIPLLMTSRSIVGVNMLKVADERPMTIKRCLEGMVEEVNAGRIKPNVGGVFSVDQLAEAHNFLEGRKSMGKIVVTW